MSKCYKCGEQWTNENRVETPLLCPKCSLAPADSAMWSAVNEFDAAMNGASQEQRARMLDLAIMVMCHNHRHAQSMQVRTTIELIFAQMTIEAKIIHPNPPNAPDQRPPT